MPDTEDSADIAPSETDTQACENAPPETGPHVIQRYVKHLGTGPGVYRMMDLAGEVIYVGKARNLKNRVQNYTRVGGHTNRIAAMKRRKSRSTGARARLPATISAPSRARAP